MNFKHLILKNLGTIQWLLTWLILIGMVIAGYFLVPIAEAKHQELYQQGVGGLGLIIPLTPITLLTMFSSGLIALIWQFRVVK